MRAELQSLLEGLDEAVQAELVVDLQLRAARGAMRSGDLSGAMAMLVSLASAARSGAQRQTLGAELRELGAALAAQRDARAENVLRVGVTVAAAESLPALAHWLQREGRLSEAATAWRDALIIAPRQSAAYLNLARVYRRMGEHPRAIDTYLALIDAVPTMSNRLVVAQELEEIAPDLPQPPAGRAIRIALLGNATLDHLRSYLRIECFKAGLRPSFYQPDFDLYNQEILDADSGLFAFEPDVLVLAVHPSRLFPNVHNDPARLSRAERRAEVETGLTRLQHLLDAFRRRSAATVLVHNMVAPQHPTAGILDLRDELGQSQLIVEINSRLAQMARSQYSGVYVVDEDGAQSRCGKRIATDARLWYSARLPWSDPMLCQLTAQYLRFIRAAKGLNRKCIVLDLDNTLWGGVIGEDGMSGIQLGSEPPGNAFVAFQRELERLWRRGILLAICSKNSPEDAFAVLEQHPEMLLRSHHFAALRINWNSKVASIREIAAELSIGLDSLVFLDDNPVERARVRAELPDVLVPDLPTDAAEYRACLLDLGVFDSLTLTDEDRQRNTLYADQRARREAQQRLSNGGGSVEEFLADLGLVVEIEPADDLNIPRIAQLTSKTNQFNMTTRRYTEADVRARIAAGWSVFAARVKDRFGDNGLTGVVMLEPDGDESWTIDTLLLSCRVMGRGVETALLWHAAERARGHGATTLRGAFIPTEKNAPARECYAGHGFRLVERHADGLSTWALDMRESGPALPDWLQVRVLVRG